MTLTSKFVETCLRVLPQRVGNDAIQGAKRCLIDSLAVAYTGYAERPIDMLRETSTAGQTNGASGVIGYSDRARATDAALVNGTMISLQLFDDNMVEMRGHPSAPLWPAILALGEQENITLNDALRYFVIGYEVECRLGVLLNPSHYEMGWHATATQGTIAATIAASLILHLNETQTAYALGIVASMASGTRRNFGSMTMSLHSGQAASNGVRAALLAQKGFTSDPAIFDGERSFGALFSREWSDEVMMQSLPAWGEPFMIVSPGATFKLFPCGRPTLFGVDAAMALQTKHGVKAADVKRIVCDCSYMFQRTVVHARPHNGFQAKTSMEYCIAASLLDGRPTLASFSDPAVKRQEISDLLERIFLHVPPELSEDVPAVRKAPFDQPVTLTIETHDGKTFSEVVRQHKGMPGNPITDADLHQKFVDCAEPHLDKARIQTILNYIERAEGNMSGLAALLPIG